MSGNLHHKTTVAGFFTEPLEPDTGKPCENSLKTHHSAARKLLPFEKELDLFSEPEERKKNRAGRGSVCNLARRYIDLVLLGGFLISLNEQAIIAAAGRRLRRRQASSASSAHVQSNFMSCPPRLSQDLFFCMRNVRKRSFFCLLLACRTIRRILRKLLWVASLFLLPIPWPSFSVLV